MKKAYIIGASSQSRVIASIINQNYEEIFFIDIVSYYGTIDASIQSKKPDNIIQEKYFFDNIEKYSKEDIYIGIGSNEVRTKIYTKLIELNILPTNCIARNAFIAQDAIIGNGVVICPGSLVGSKAIIGNNTIINSISSVDHDCEIGANSHVAAGVTLGGYTIIGENCFLGIKSATIPKIKIGNNSIVMAGSIVYKSVPKDTMVGGNPARLIKKLET